MWTGFYAEGVTFQSPGSRRSRAPWVTEIYTIYPEGVGQNRSNPFGVHLTKLTLTQGGAAAPLTLGFGMKPLRGKEFEVSIATTFGDLFSLLHFLHLQFDQIGPMRK